jgi:predicted nucleic acid-binding protein
MPGGWAYFDTSALVKRYVSEIGSVRARSLLNRHRFLSSAIAPIELMSALCHRAASGELTPADFARIQSKLKKDRLVWELVEVTPGVLNQAEQLVMQTSLRTLDALHVATALSFQTMSGIRVPFITGDARQREAADKLELNVVWVG